MADPWQNFDPLRTPVVSGAPAPEADPWAAFNPAPPPEKAKAKTEDEWAAFNPTKPPKEPDVIKDVAVQVVANIPKGMAGTADFAEMISLPQATAKGIRYLLGDTKSHVDKLESVYKAPTPETKLGEYGATVGELVGSSIVPGAGWLGVARNIAANAVKAPAQTMAGRLVQNAATTTANNPVRSILFDLASATTGGIAQQGAKDAGFGRAGQTIASLAGGFVPLLPSVARIPFQRAREYVATQGENAAYKRFVDQLPEGIDEFRTRLATGATRRDAETQVQTFDTLGEEMRRLSAANDPRVDAAARVLADKRGIDIEQARNEIIRRDATGATIDRLVKEQGITPDTAKDRLRKLTAVWKDSDLFLAETPAAMPSNELIRNTRNIDNLDMRRIANPGETGAHHLIDDLANSPGSAAFTTRGRVGERNLDVKDTVRGRLEQLSPIDPVTLDRMTIESVPDRVEQLRKVASLDYDKAYSAPTNFDLMKTELPALLEKHNTIAAGRYGETADKLRQGLTYINEAWRRGDLDTALQRMQDARGELRQLRDGVGPKGERWKTQAYNALDNLYDDVTDLMTRANPQWGTANARWADMNIMDEAQRIGESFAEKAGPKFRKDFEKYQRLDPEVQDVVKTFWLNKFFDKLTNAKDTHDVAKHFRDDHTRSMIRSFFGDEALLEVAKMTRDAAIATKSGGMLANSKTHFRKQRQIVADADTGIMPSMEATAQEGPKKAMLGQLWSVLSDRMNKPLARIATTPVRDTAQVALEVQNMRKAMEFLDRLRNTRSMPITPPLVSTGIGAGITSDRQQ